LRPVGGRIVLLPPGLRVLTHTRKWNLTFENNAPRQKGGSTRPNVALSRRSGPRQKACEARLKFGFATAGNEFTEFIVTLPRHTIE
jgi:hypothetical protein